MLKALEVPAAAAEALSSVQAELIAAQAELDATKVAAAEAAAKAAVEAAAAETACAAQVASMAAAVSVERDQARAARAAHAVELEALGGRISAHLRKAAHMGGRSLLEPHLLHAELRTSRSKMRVMAGEAAATQLKMAVTAAKAKYGIHCLQLPRRRLVVELCMRDVGTTHPNAGG